MRHVCPAKAQGAIVAAGDSGTTTGDSDTKASSSPQAQSDGTGGGATGGKGDKSNSIKSGAASTRGKRFMSGLRLSVRRLSLASNDIAQ